MLTNFALGAVILAAGASARMGRPKMLLPWRGTSVLGHVIQQWSGRAAQLTVVHAGEHHPVRGELDRLGFAAEQRILNPHPELGMFESVRSAARWSGWRKAITHAALILGDQPLIKEETLDQLIAFAQSHRDTVCQLVQGGHRRHPVVFPLATFGELARTNSATLKEFLEPIRQRTALCECDDAGLSLDLDRPEDYVEALKWM